MSVYIYLAQSRCLDYILPKLIFFCVEIEVVKGYNYKMRQIKEPQILNYASWPCDHSYSIAL